MKIATLVTSAVFAWIAAGSASAQLVTYTFGPTAGPIVTPDLVANNVAAGVFSGLTGNPSTGGTSPLSSGAYFTANTWSGSSENNYLTFTITPEPGYQFSTVSLSLDYRATSTGPTTLALYSSVDDYASALDSFTVTRDTTWYSSGAIPLSLNNLTTATTFRIYGSGADSDLGTLRVDNVVLSGSVTPVPEPSTYALLGGAGSLGFAVFRRRRTRPGNATRFPDSVS